MKLAFLMKNPKLQEILMNAYTQLDSQSWCAPKSPWTYDLVHSMLKSWTIDRATAILLCFLLPFVKVSGHFLELKPEPLRSRYRDILVLSSSLGEVNRSIRKAVPSSLAAHLADLQILGRYEVMNSFEGIRWNGFTISYLFRLINCILFLDKANCTILDCWFCLSNMLSSMFQLAK